MTRSPAFWWRPRPGLAAAVLAPVGALWGAIAAIRMARDGAVIGIPVVTIGNFVAGGAGKTPTAIALAGLLDANERLFFLTRGHGGRLGRSPTLVDLAKHNATDVGDEALLLARVAPTVVARDRRLGALAAKASGATVVVQDDGLQSNALKPCLAFAVVDAAIGIGNGRCLPGGPLRAPLAAQWRRTSAVLLVGEGASRGDLASQAANEGKLALTASLKADDETVKRASGRKFVAFAGIGRPSKFFDTLREIGALLVATREFADHRVYTKTDLDALRGLAQGLNADLITTEKDAVRLPAAFQVEKLPVRLVFDDPQRAGDLLRKAIEGARRS